MSDDRHQTSECLDAETLAAFMDGRLEPRERAAVEAHLADCDDCYEVWMEGMQLAAPPPIAARPSKRHFTPTRIGALAAAVLAVVYLGQEFERRTGRDSARDPVDQLVAAVSTSRLVEGRITGGFAWGTLAPATRGGVRHEPPPELRIAEAQLAIALREERTPSRLAAFAGAKLLLGQTDEAIRLYQELIEALPADPDAQSNLAAAYLERARWNDSRSDAADALTAAEVALHTQSTHAEALFNRAAALEILGPRDAAVRGWRAFLDVDASSGWATEARERLKRLESSPPTELVRDGKLIIQVEEVLLPAWAIAPPAQRAEALWAIAELLPAIQTLNDAPATVELMQSALDAGRRRVGQHDHIARYVLSLAKWRRLYSEGRQADAQAIALELEGLAHLGGIATVDARVAVMLGSYAAGQWEETLRLCRAIESDASARQHSRALARVAQVRGIVSLQDGAFSEGIEHYEAALTLADRAKDFRLMAAVNGLIGDALAEQGDTSNAWRYLSTALALLDQITAPRARYSILSSAAIVADTAGQPGAALRFADELLISSQSWANPGGRALALLQRATARARLGSPEDARADLAEATALVSELPDVRLRDAFYLEVRIAEGRVLAQTSPQESIDAFSTALETLQAEANVYRSVDILLRRGRAFLLLGQQAKAEADWQRGIELLEAQRLEINESGRRVSRLDRLSDLYAELISLRRKSAETSLDTFERLKARELLGAVSGSLTNAPLSGRAAYEWLPPATVVIAYSVQPTRTFIWLVSRDGATITESPLGATALARKVSEHEDAVKRGVGIPSELTATLVPRLIDIATVETVIIIPDGPLHRLAFSALRLADGRFLVEAVTLMMAPSLSVLKALRGPSRSPRVLLAGDARTKPHLGLPALPLVAMELSQLNTMYAGREGTTVLEGDNATRARLMAAASTAGIIHIAAHAIPPTTSRGPSGIAFGNSLKDLLTMDDIATWTLTGRPVVVLATCESAVGLAPRGEGPLTIARPFLASGASSVIATLWPIVDSDTTPLVVDLHRELQANTPPRALALAQRHRIRQGWPASRWAGFAAFGGMQ